MKKLIPILLFLMACHTLKVVTTTQVASRDSEHSFVDTSQLTTSSLKIVNDSSHTTTTIIPDGNFTFDNGKFTGKAKSITTQKTTVKHETATKTKVVKKGISDKTSVTVKQAKNTQVVTHPFNWWWLTTLIPVIVGLYLKYRKQ